MKIRDCMSPDVHLAHPGDTIQSAAATMAEIDAGAIPVSEDDRLGKHMAKRPGSLFRRYTPRGKQEQADGAGARSPAN